MNLSLVEVATDPAIQPLPADDTAFESLYRRFYPRLVRLLLRRTGDKALAEDLAQETLLRAFTNLGEGLDPSIPLWPWLKTVATRLVIDHARCSNREVLCETELPADPAADHLEGFDDDLIAEAMKKLTGSQRMAVSMRYLDDWKSAEAASFLGINRVAFEQLLLRARRRLKTEYIRLSQQTSAIVVLSYRRLRRLFHRMADSARGSGSGAGTIGTIGVEAATQLTAGVLSLLVIAGSAGDIAYERSPQIALDSTSHPITRPQPEGGPIGGPGHHGSGPVGTASFASLGEREPEKELIRDLGDPNRGATQPEDARITSIAFGPGSGSGQTIYAAGRTGCNNRCSRVLFASTDGGSSWFRMAASGFEGDELMVPAGGDGKTIFAMGPLGLQASRDGGHSFDLAAVAGAPITTGSAAVSPAFFGGDPTILIGAQSLLRYRDETGIVEPYPSALVGPLNPVYSPAYPVDPRIFVGSTKIEPLTNEVVATVTTCNGSVCTDAPLPGGRFLPEVRMASDFSKTGVALAFDRDHLFWSRDGAKTFGELSFGDGHIRDVAYTDGGSIMASVVTNDREAGHLLISIDGGAQWRAADSPLFDGGATEIAVSGQRIMVGLEKGGLACSTDGGATWAHRCS